MEGVSFIIPARNGAATLVDTLASIEAQHDRRPMEVIVIDDRSTDGTRQLLTAFARRSTMPVRIMDADGRGAAAALNVGVRAARYPVICQVDQDVVLKPGWMDQLVTELTDPSVGAAQGYYEMDPRAGLYARAMSLDLEQRYAAIVGRYSDHVCTGNTAYRAAALYAAGLFDESLGYGYDNDISYRLRRAGFDLAFCRNARSVHKWREGLWGYLGQQYGFGYGRLDVVAKHPDRFGGDTVSRWPMMLHAPATALALSLYGTAGVAAAAGGRSTLLVVYATAILVALALERCAAGIRAARRFRTPLSLLFPILHFGRDVAWAAAMLLWLVRRLSGRPTKPSHSMMTRTDSAW